MQGEPQLPFPTVLLSLSGLWGSCAPQLCSTAALSAWESSGWLCSQEGVVAHLSTWGGLFEEPSAWGAGSALAAVAGPLLPDFFFFLVIWR